MKKTIRVIALVAAFILSSFGMSDAASYDMYSDMYFVSMD